MRRDLPLQTTLLSLLLLSSAASADDAGLLRCRAISDAVARLACYDALPVAGVEAKTPGQPGQADQRSMQQLFGLEDSFAPPPGLGAIESSISGRVEGWGPTTRFRLANGQVWQVADGSSRLVDAENPKVTITRGMLGAFYLSINDDNRTVRVRRIQ